MKLTLGLCDGRHDLPVSGYVYPSTVDPQDVDCLDRQAAACLRGCDTLDLYVTGLTVALVAVINYCCRNVVDLTLWHYNREGGSYFPQEVFTREDLDLVAEAGYGGYSQRLRR